MHKSINTTSPRHNDETQTSQRKNALATGATDATAHTPTQKLQDELETLKDQHYDAMALSLERIEMLQAVIDDTFHALQLIKREAHKHLTEPLSTRLGIGQLLAMDFIQSLSDDIAELEGKA